MSEVLFTLTTFIEAVMSNHRYNEYTLDSNNNTIEFRITSCGDSLDIWCNDEWLEDAMIFDDNYPLEDDVVLSDIIAKEYADTPVRTHGYSNCYREYTLSLPPTRKRGDTYTLSEIRAMVSDIQNHEDIPGCGFSYHNMPECEEEYDWLVSA